MRLLNLAAILAALVGSAGCGSSDGPKLVDAGGTILFQSRPVADASVVFVPEKGPVATGISDFDGKFTLSTGSRHGVVVGPAKVAVVINAPADDHLASPQTMEEGRKMMMEMMAKRGTTKRAKSAIPEKYHDPDTSGLSVTISDDPDKNQFTFEL